MMTWNPESRRHTEAINLTSTIASRVEPEHGVSSAPDKLRRSDGKTYGEWQLPEPAPLVFPGLDQLAAGTSDGEKKQLSSFAKKYRFAAEYFDKRATAEWVCYHSGASIRRLD
jgi:hypothetical protein